MPPHGARHRHTPLVTKIELSTFNGCTALTTVMLPSSVSEIKSYAFHSCRSLTAIALPASLTARVTTADADEIIGFGAFYGGCLAFDEPSTTAIRAINQKAIDEDE
jgi:hypothetical protein